MAISKFNNRGVLPKGLHKCKTGEFIERFCLIREENGELRGGSCTRREYKEVLEQLFGFSMQRGAKSIIFGGSFITNKEVPDDLDCIVIFPNHECIPSKTEIVIVSGCKLDIVYAVEENKKMIYSLMNMFAKDRFELEVGLVEVSLDGDFDSSWDDFLQEENFSGLLKEREAYIWRHCIVGDQKKGILVTIHGINTDAHWNFDLAPIVSANNWIFAPFAYGNLKLPLISEQYAKDILTCFRDWINSIYKKYNMRPSILAHSFGTYIIGKYISGFNFNPPVKFENIILAGSILNTDFDWKSSLDTECIKSLLNIVSPNDPWVPHIEKIKWLRNEKLYGTAGIQGFSQKHPRLFSEKLEIFDHGNMLKTDVFESIILPHLSISKNLEKFNFLKYINEESFRRELR